jgi:hypothetical protein
MLCRFFVIFSDMLGNPAPFLIPLHTLRIKQNFAYLCLPNHFLKGARGKLFMCLEQYALQRLSLNPNVKPVPPVRTAFLQNAKLFQA